MQACNEVRRHYNWLRSNYNKGKKNGCIDGWALDCPNIERKDFNSKRNYERHKEKRVEL